MKNCGNIDIESQTHKKKMQLNLQHQQIYTVKPSKVALSTKKNIVNHQKDEVAFTGKFLVMQNIVDMIFMCRTKSIIKIMIHENAYMPKQQKIYT